MHIDNVCDCRSAAVVSKTISGLSSYFGNRQVAGRSTGNRRNS